MPRLRVLTAIAALCLAAATALAGCGGDDVELLPGATAREINTNLDRVERSAAEGDCAGAAAAANEVSAQVAALDVDAKLKRALEQGTERLREVVAECEEEASEETEAFEEEELEPSEEEAEPEEEKPSRRKPKAEAEAPRDEEGGRAAPSPQGGGKGKGGGEKPSPETPAEPGPGGTETPGGISPSAPVGGE